MRNVLTIIIILLSLKANAQSLRLIQVGEQTTFEVGQQIELELSITELEGRLSDELEGDDLILDLKNFKKRIVVICKKSGEREIGPYEITLNGKTLKSNTVSLHIIEPTLIEEVQDTIITMLVPESVQKGKEFSILLKSNIQLNNSSDKKNIQSPDDLGQVNSKTLKVRDNSMLKQLNFSYSKSTVIKDGKSKSEYIYKFKVKARQEGKVDINFSFFDPELPSVFNSKIVEIK